ncbi:glomulin isoform X2 [Microcaecilia unicolor]|nr:glomulin isoform X2 [Microcaecilia unicolor]XP_030061235.1 glomulin isoform X2 [Microcaecilia unicolor]XP_030061236.1 glomulin isoform X2 [Microcaecilia unicolor]XP_030061237.1 glomulin isoform X2 [Microcaecilia unicolor]
MAVEELRTITQRCQALEEDAFKGEDFDLFQSAGQQCLEEGHIAQVLEIIQDEKNKVIVKCMGWNLVGPLVRCIQCYPQKSEKQEACLRILDQMVQLCNPKELLLGLLEQVEDACGEDISPIISLLLQPLQTVLIKLGDKKAYSVGLALSTLVNRISTLPIPYTKDQIQQDPHGLCHCCSSLVTFAKPFVAEVVKRQEYSKELKSELLKFCFSCLKYLLRAQLDQIPDDTEEHPLRFFATEILDFLWLLGEPLSKVFFQHGSTPQASDKEDLSQDDMLYCADSLACLAYLLFVHYIGMDYFPHVFSPSFLLQCNMTHIEMLLKRMEESMLSKGLALFENCLLRVENNSLPHQYLEIKSFLSVPEDLVKVMTLCPVEHLRKKSLKILQLYIDKLDAEGKYKLFRCLLQTSNHAGMEGYIIQNIKNQIDLSLKTGYGSNCFLGPRLIPLLHTVHSLPEGVETDLLQNSDRIMAALNLLRYLIIKDPEYENQTEIWTELTRIERDFLKPLRMGLNMSKAHYEAKIRSTKEDRQESHNNKTICTITAGGKTLPNMTPEMQLQVLQSALFTFDLIESVLARVEELIEVKGKAMTEEQIGSNQDI